MAVAVDIQNTGDPVVTTEVIAAIEHLLADRPGNWRVSIIGSQANDRWELKSRVRTLLSARTRSKALLASIGQR
jgi:hypothetical protein